MWLIQQMRLRIRYKIIGPFLVLTLCTAVFGSGIAFLLVANSWQERLINQLAAVTRIANDTVVEQEMTNLLFLRAIAFASANSETGAPAVSEALAAGDVVGLRQALEPFFLVGITDVHVQVDRLMVFDRAGQTLVDIERTAETSLANRVYTMHPALNLANVGAVQRVLVGGVGSEDDKFAGLVALPDSAGTMQTYLYTIVPVSQGVDGAIVGGALMAVQLNRLLAVLRSKSQAAIITLYAMDGTPLWSTAFEEVAARQAGDEQIFRLALEEEEAPLIRTRDWLQVDPMDVKLLEAQAASGYKNKPVVTTIAVNGRDYQFLYTYLVIHGERVGILSAALSGDYVVRGWGDTRLPVLGVTLVVMLSIVGVGMVVARQVTAPLEHLVAAVSVYVAGGASQPDSEGWLEKSSSLMQDEIEILSSSFRRMNRREQELLTRVLQESSQRAAILESIPDGMVVCDAMGVIQSMNPTMRQLLGLAHDAVLPRHVRDLPLERVAEPLFGAHQAGLYVLGEAIVRVSKSPVMSQDTCLGDVYLLQDMTAEANIDRARTTFTATISHELRTPLTVVHGNVQLLLQGLTGTLNDQQRPLVDTIYQHTNHMNRLLANAILIAEIDTGSFVVEPEPVVLREAIERIVRPLRRGIAEKGLTFTVDVPDGLPKVLVDEYALAPIMKQLVENARTYTEMGGITIRATLGGGMCRWMCVIRGVGLGRCWLTGCLSGLCGARGMSPTPGRIGGSGWG